MHLQLNLIKMENFGLSTKNDGIQLELVCINMDIFTFLILALGKMIKTLNVTNLIMFYCIKYM